MHSKVSKYNYHYGAITGILDIFFTPDLYSILFLFSSSSYLFAAVNLLFSSLRIYFHTLYNARAIYCLAVSEASKFL